MKKLALSLVLTLGVSGLAFANNGHCKNQLNDSDKSCTNTIETSLCILV